MDVSISSKTTKLKIRVNLYRGLQLRIWTDRTIFSNDDPIWIKLSFKNTSSQEVAFWQSGFWPNTRIEVYDFKMKPVAQTLEGKEKLKMFAPGGERNKNFEVKLRSGDIYELDPIEIRTLFELKPNHAYFVVACYEEHQMDGWNGRLVSNKLRVQTR